ncbi:voltage-gated potassium channel [Agromyces cerinus]|uniref:potassium channel family protein n=1 Tax=Agromyces cerinus TaxID=33878 RepID=UPI00195B2E71|nr:potassium channel family protein [Agromyces cerinus]MBM7831177.1 voltage-gated potassium channel [Agromyces cerinus]
MAHRSAPAPRRHGWEQRTTVPLFALGVAFIIAYSVLVLVQDLPPEVRLWLMVILGITWVVFIVDLVVRVSLTPHGDKWHFIGTHPIDVLSALLPVFRAFRVLVLLREVPYLQRKSGAAVRTNIVIYAICYSVLFIYFISLATLSVERDAPGASITSFGEALWWAVVTVATVGYGDAYPVTVPGRLYAVLLMAGGVAIVGTASATIISLINERIGLVRISHEAPVTASGAPSAATPAEEPVGGPIPMADLLADAPDDPLTDRET